MSILHKALIKSLGRIAVALAIAASAVTQSYAEVRPWAADYSSIINQNAPTQRVARHFRRVGAYRITRGVLFDSSAVFFLERGSGRIPVAASALALDMDAAGRVFLTHAGTRFQMEVHAGLSCPLGRFVQRNGTLAYSITAPARFSQELGTHGLVPGTEREGFGREWIPREFSGSPFLDLLYEADLAREVVDLPENVSTSLLVNVNRAVGRLPRSVETFDVVDGSYMNTDSLIPYRVFLVAGANRVDVSGVPLRYHWREGRDGSLIVIGVQAFSQDFKERGISNLASRGASPTHYDVVVLYQTAAVFRALRRTDPARFTQFVTRACATR